LTNVKSMFIEHFSCLFSNRFSYMVVVYSDARFVARISWDDSGLFSSRSL
jgi:hypothetical protein